MGQVIVDRDDVAAAAGESAEKRGQGGRKGLALARLHLGDVPLEESDASLNLHEEVLEAQLATGRFADESKRFDQQAAQARLRLGLPAQFATAAEQFGIALVAELFRSFDDDLSLRAPAREPRGIEPAAPLHHVPNVVACKHVSILARGPRKSNLRAASSSWPFDNIQDMSFPAFRTPG